MTGISINAGAPISDTAYDESTWNGDTGNAPSKNAMRDKIQSMNPAGAVVLTDEDAGSSGSYVDLATSGPAVTLDVPASGKVIVFLSGYFGSSAAVNLQMGVALSGANTVAANDDQAINHNCRAASIFSTNTAVIPMTGLTPGSTTFTAKYKKPSGTASFSDRRIAVFPA